MKQLDLSSPMLDQSVAQEEFRKVVVQGAAAAVDADNAVLRPSCKQLSREQIVIAEPLKTAIKTEDRLRNLGEEALKQIWRSNRGGMSLSTYQFVKRAIDASVATATLVLLSPLLLIIAAIIKLCDGGAVLYRHERVGLMGKRFECVKFRSMVRDADEVFRSHLAANPQAREEWQKNQKLSNDPRITWIGRFLRKSSLDELPQLINILAGDMSLVGPRPITVEELDRYEERVGHYLAVKPGLTGLWQISGRNERTYAERVELDATYAATRSLWFDLVIILKTVPAVISQRGSS